jgi:hypothetical protein
MSVSYGKSETYFREDSFQQEESYLTPTLQCSIMPGLLVRIIEVAAAFSGDSLNTLTARTFTPTFRKGAMSTVS